MVWISSIFKLIGLIKISIVVAEAYLPIKYFK